MDDGWSGNSTLLDPVYPASVALRACLIGMLKRKTMKTALAEVGSAGKASATVAKPGVNCWQRCRAERAAFLVDAADYYRALRSSIIKAERSVIILGWDIHSKLSLIHI